LRYHKETELGGLQRYNFVKTSSKTLEQDDNCIQFSDYYSYKITKIDKELLCIDEIGIILEPQRKLYRIVNGHNYYINFKNIGNIKGVPLFAKCLEDILDLKEVETSALNIISEVFGIILSSNNRSNNNNLSKYDYVYALFDFKRAMDYLQVKACIEGNKNYNKNNITYIFVSNDRLAIQYALLNNCPCIITSNDIGKLYIPNKTQIGTGTELNISKLRRNFLLNYPKLKPYTRKEQNSNIEIKINLANIIPNLKGTLFGKFLTVYTNKFSNEINLFWYVTYFTIYSLLINDF